MPSDSKNLVPLSILGAGALIGAGLFFGLRERPIIAPVIAPVIAPTSSAAAAPPPAAATAPVEAPALAAEAPASAPGPVSPEVVTKATEDATRALEKAKKKLEAACWKPAIAENPEPKRARFIFNLSFDARGQEIARGVTELRDESRADVGQCLRAQPIGLEIPPPGAIIAVSIALEFP